MTPKRIIKLRQELHLTQQQLANMIGAQQTTVSRWEVGRNEPKGAYLKALNELAKNLKRQKTDILLIFRQQTLWYKILNPGYTREQVGRNFFKDSNLPLYEDAQAPTDPERRFFVWN